MNLFSPDSAQVYDNEQKNLARLLLLRRFPYFLTFLVLTALLLFLTGCGGLASEPPIIVTAPLPTITPTSPPDLGHPPARVSLARGAEIFGGQPGCWDCHGISGQGNCPVSANFSCKITELRHAD